MLGAVAILFFGWISSKWLQRRVWSLGKKNRHLDEMLFDFLASIVRYVVLGFTALFVLNTFGLQTTSVIAVIGAAGLAIGFALQGTLSNKQVIVPSLEVWGNLITNDWRRISLPSRPT